MSEIFEYASSRRTLPTFHTSQQTRADDYIVGNDLICPVLLTQITELISTFVVDARDLTRDMADGEENETAGVEDHAISDMVSDFHIPTAFHVLFSSNPMGICSKMTWLITTRKYFQK